MGPALPMRSCLFLCCTTFVGHTVYKLSNSDPNLTITKGGGEGVTYPKIRPHKNSILSSRWPPRRVFIRKDNLLRTVVKREKKAPMEVKKIIKDWGSDNENISGKNGISKFWIFTPMTLHPTVQYSTVQYSEVLYCTVHSHSPGRQTCPLPLPALLACCSTWRACWAPACWAAPGCSVDSPAPAVQYSTVQYSAVSLSLSLIFSNTVSKICNVAINTINHSVE